MIPVRTAASNFVYRGPSPDIGDAWVERRPREHVVYLTWQPSDEERAAIAAGGLVKLGIFYVEPIPPVSLNVVYDRPLTDAGVELRERARNVLTSGESRVGQTVPAGYWHVSPDVWAALNTEGALDAGDGLPSLHGRPLLEGTDAGRSDVLEFIAQEA